MSFSFDKVVKKIEKASTGAQVNYRLGYDFCTHDQF